MTEKKLRRRVTRFVLLSNSVLFVLVFILFFMRGLDLEELSSLVGLLVPITGVYMGALIKYALANPYENNGSKDRKVSKMYVMVTYWAIPLHFFILFFAILAYALFNAFAFEVLKLLFTTVEGFFGAYIGLIVASIFRISAADKPQE